MYFIEKSAGILVCLLWLQSELLQWFLLYTITTLSASYPVDFVVLLSVLCEKFHVDVNMPTETIPPS